MMNFVALSVAILAFSVSLVAIKSEPIEGLTSGKVKVNCTQLNSCADCMAHEGHCVFYYCLNDKHTEEGPSFCETPNVPKPTTNCPTGKWHRLDKGQTCADINTTTTTTTPSTTTSTTTTSTTTTTPNTTTTTTTSTTTTSSTTIKPTPSPTTPATSPKPKPDQNEQRLTGWTIAGIVISSLVVILVLVGVSYKKVMKIYRARNPYRHFDEDN